MEGDILDIYPDDIIIRETQQTDHDSPATFSHKLIDRFGICQHRHCPEAVDNNQNENLLMTLLGTPQGQVALSCK